MSQSTESAGGGIGIGDALFLIFATLKLTEVGTVATWSWLWVTSPLWIPVCLIAAFTAVGLALWAVLEAYDWFCGRSKRGW